jgi:hypothetical protein
VLGGVNFKGSFEFFDFELFFTLLLGLSLSMPFCWPYSFASSR